MCPDKEILSLYVDQELPSPWKEQLEDHLGECPRCRHTVARYRSLRALLREGEGLPDRERSWEKLQSRIALGGKNSLSRDFDESSGAGRLRRLWERRVSLPLPAAAAAAVLVALLAFAATALSLRLPPGTQTLATDLESEQNLIPVASDANGVLRFLGQEDSGDFEVLRLPDSQNFNSSGKPRIIKAADYSRSSPPR